MVPARKPAGSGWGADASTLFIGALRRLVGPVGPALGKMVL